MKFMHLSDLHIGKRLNEFSLAEDQAHILDKILETAKNERVDAVIIAGDIYDRSVPSVEGVRLFDRFITALSEMGIYVFIISGNHDSPERLAFGSGLMAASRVFISPVYEGDIEPVKLSDEFGDIFVYLLPFVKPAQVRHYFPDEKIESYTQMMEFIVSRMDIDKNKRNILVTHQYAAGAEKSDSEETLTAGGTESIDFGVFSNFDYTALGHIHKAQFIGGKSVRYCGTPLKYSFNEEYQEKTLTILELSEKGRISFTEIPLQPLRDMRTIKGTYEELTALSFYGNTNTDDYIRAILTDEDDVVNAMARLRTIYPNLMTMSYENSRTKADFQINDNYVYEDKSPMEHFSDFFEMVNGSKMSEKQRKFTAELIEKITEEGQQ
ncbi:MAG: exonuclease SbcCD subunit D [Firmicutes bacterium]|nr:exonuclease SbcCD subunit D [Bacillota bacterium]